MSLTPEAIRKIAHLARLNLSEDDLNQMTQKLTSTLNFIEQMNQVDTTNVTPLAHPFDLNQRLRPDEVTELNLRDKFQRIAPSVEAGLYLVPKVIE